MSRVRRASKKVAAVAPAEVVEEGSATVPSIEQQKTFIIENASILNRETKLAILSIVMMEVGPSVVMEPGGAQESDIDLDAVALINEEVITHIYNIIRARRAVLSRPVGVTRKPY